MGYTLYHYRNENLNPAKFKRFAKDVAKIYEKAKDLGIAIAGAHGVYDTPPVANETLVSFNGAGSEMCETLYIRRNAPQVEYRKNEKLVFEFCKTERKPYTVIVAAVLVAFEHYFKHARISGDDDLEGFEEGIKICEALFGYGSDFRIR